MKKYFDIVVIGGGITATATAISLLKRGHSVAVVEKTSLKKFKQGESFAPEIKRHLALLGFQYNNSSAIEYCSSSSVWGNDIVVERDHIFNPYGNGLSVDRQMLEQQLMSAAERQGAVIYLNAKPLVVNINNDECEIILDRESCPALKSRLVIFATGRSAHPLSKSGSRNYLDKLVALTVICKEQQTVARSGLYVESLPNGWFYTNMIPGNKRIYSYFTDSDLLEQWDSRLKILHRMLTSTKWYLHDPVLLSTEQDNVHVIDARTRWSNNQYGYRWLEVGDAAFTIDPLSGQGVYKNLQAVEFCVNAINDFFSNYKKAGAAYLEYNKTVFKNYLHKRAETYGLENRWQSNHFWRRRQLTSSDFVQFGSAS